MLKMVVVARCDHCGGIKLITRAVPPKIVLYANRFLPEGWETAKSDGEIFHFCGKQCRKEWLAT